MLDTIVLFGDSLTQAGWQPHAFAQRLAYVYARKLDVINRGHSGYNTEWAIPVFEQIIAKHVPQIALLTLWFGANDACLPPSPQHVPPARFRANLVRLVRMLRSPASASAQAHGHDTPPTRVLLLTPPPVNTVQRAADLGGRDPPRALDRAFATTAAYAEGVREVGREMGVPVVDVWTALFEAAGREESRLDRYLEDGLHLTSEGYAVVFDLLMETIGKEFPELHYDNLPMTFPRWSDIDFEDPRSSILAQQKP